MNQATWANEADRVAHMASYQQLDTDLLFRSLASPWRGLRDTQLLPPLLTEQGELLRLFLTI